MIRRTNYPNLLQPVGTYVHAVAYQGLLYVSGLTAFGTDAQKLGVGEQTAAVMQQLHSIMFAEDCDFQHLLKVTIFTCTTEPIDAIRNALKQNYQDHLPASSLVAVKQLFHPDLKIEIEAIVALPNTK